MLGSGKAAPAGGGKPGSGPPTSASMGATVAETNVTVFDEALKAALDRAETRLSQLKSADAKTKAGRFALLDEAMREVGTMRRSFHGEMQLLRPQDKGPFRQALEGYDRRIQSLEQQAKYERASNDKMSLLGGKMGKNPFAADGGANGDAEAPPPNSNDAMLKETEKIQAKTTSALERTRKRATEARDIGREVADALAGQTDQIMRIDQGMTEMDSELKRANQIMMSIARRVATDRLVLCFGLLLVGFVIAVVVVIVVDPSAVKPSAPPAANPGAGTGVVTG